MAEGDFKFPFERIMIVFIVIFLVVIATAVAVIISLA